MDFSTKPLDAKSNLSGGKTACIVVGIYENKKLTPEAQALNASGAISAALKSGDVTGKPGSVLVLRNLTGIAAERVVLVGLGSEPTAKSSGGLNNTAFSKIAASTAQCLAALSAADVLITLTMHAANCGAGIRAMVVAMRSSAYRCDGLKSKPEVITTGATKVALAVPAKDLASAKTSLTQSVAHYRNNNNNNKLINNNNHSTLQLS